MPTIPQGTVMSDTDIHRLVQHHDGQLHALNTRVGHVEQKLDVHDGKLDKIIAAVTTQSAQPKFEMRAVLGLVKDFGVIFVMVCGGILYLATRQTETPIALIQKDQADASQRLERMESLVLPDRWASRTERSK
jgi:hypothetical protein